MNLFVDENIPAQIVRQLRDLSHNVIYAAELDPGRDDTHWLTIAHDENRILITDDKDFGELVFRRRLVSAGIILLRLHRLPIPQRLDWLQPRWPTILNQPAGSFVVVTERRIRVRPAAI